MAQTAGTFMSNRAVWMVSLSCRLDALADSVSGIMREKKKAPCVHVIHSERCHVYNFFDQSLCKPKSDIVRSDKKTTRMFYFMLIIRNST